MKFLTATMLITGVAVASMFVFVYAGFFNVAADAPHSAFTYTVMEAIRSRSITVRVKDVQPPPLDDEKLVATGAEHYAAMCSGCHLSPGQKGFRDSRRALSEATRFDQAPPRESRRRILGD